MPQALSGISSNYTVGPVKDMTKETFLLAYSSDHHGYILHPIKLTSLDIGNMVSLAAK